MKTPVNSRDIALQATAIRVLGVSTNYINLTCPTQQFKYGTDNVAQPASTIVTATLVGALQGTVTFTTTGFSEAPIVNGNQLTVDPDKITGDFATISATLVYQGETYTAVPVSISKIFNQLVARITTPNSQVPSYSDGTGYTLPTADNFIELYNGVVKLATGVVYGPATQTKNGLVVAVNTTTGKITVSEVNPNTWTSTTENFTLTATRGTIAYNATYTVTKAKQGFGGQQVATLELYQWSTAQPAVPTGTSTYTWTTKAHSYNNTDSWRTTVSASPGGVGIKLWRVTKAINAAAEATTPTFVTTWASGATVQQVTTDANALIKTRIAIVYKNDISPPVPPAGTATYNWASSTISAAPSGWTLVAEDTPAGFTLYQAAVDLLAAQSETSSTIDWTLSSIIPLRYSGSNAINAMNSITAALTNATHIIPSNTTNATISNFANSGTDLFVYEGATPLVYDGVGTDIGTFKVTATASGVTAGTASAVTVNNATGVKFEKLTASTFANNATGKITYVVSGKRLSTSIEDTAGTAFSYTVEQTFTKTSRGALGAAGSAIWLTTSASVIQKNSSGVFNPPTVTISGKQAATTAGTISNYSGWFKIFKNNDTVAVYTSSVAEASTVYTITGSNTSKLRVEMYSTAQFTTLLDQETIYITSDTNASQTDAVARRAYVVATTTPAATPASLVVTGDNVPTAGTWFTGKVYSTTAPTDALAENESLYQVDGVYINGGDTTWGFPYLSSLKVGNLQAITANTGNLTISGSIKGGTASNLTTGNGFYVDSNGYLRVGNPSGAQLKFDAAGLSITDASGTDIFTVVSGAESAASDSADSASAAADAADAALAAAGSVTWLGSAGIKVVTGIELQKTATTSAWDVHRYSAESYTNGAYISFIPGATSFNFMIGMDSNPTQNASYETIDYAWYCQPSGALQIYENGNGFNISSDFNTYSTSTVLSIIYDGRYVKYYRNGTVIRTVEPGAGLKLQADSSFYNQGASAKSIRFGPVGTIGANGAAATISIGTITTGNAGTSASVTNSGTSSAAVLNFTIPKGSAGADSTVPGPRGSVTAYISGYTSWNSAVATTYFNTNYGGVVLNDTVTQYGPNFSQTRFWNGSSWVEVTVAIDGNLLVTGTVGADKISTSTALIGHQIKNQTGTFVMDFGALPFISISI